MKSVKNVKVFIGIIRSQFENLHPGVQELPLRYHSSETPFEMWDIVSEMGSRKGMEIPKCIHLKWYTTYYFCIR